MSFANTGPNEFIYTATSSVYSSLFQTSESDYFNISVTALLNRAILIVLSGYILS